MVWIRHNEATRKDIFWHHGHLDMTVLVRNPGIPLALPVCFPKAGLMEFNSLPWELPPIEKGLKSKNHLCIFFSDNKVKKKHIILDKNRRLYNFHRLFQMACFSWLSALFVVTLNGARTAPGETLSLGAKFFDTFDDHKVQRVGIPMYLIPQDYWANYLILRSFC